MYVPYPNTSESQLTAENKSRGINRLEICDLTRHQALCSKRESFEITQIYHALKFISMFYTVTR